MPEFDIDTLIRDVSAETWERMLVEITLGKKPKANNAAEREVRDRPTHPARLAGGGKLTGLGLALMLSRPDKGLLVFLLPSFFCPHKTVIFTKRFFAVSMVLLLVNLASASFPPPTSAQDAGWTTLFDGSTLDGWNVLGGANWSLDESDGSVTADMGTEGHLVTESSYDDFEVIVEFWVDPPTNSGVYIRCSDPTEITARNCYEVNISDMRADQTYRTGAIVGVSPPSEVVDAGGRWNEYVIRADGPRLTVTLNGIETVDAADSSHSVGVIGLQYSTGLVKFRRVRIRPL